MGIIPGVWKFCGCDFLQLLLRDLLAQIKHSLIGGSLNIIGIFPHLLFVASLHAARLISSFVIAPKMEALHAKIAERIQAGDKLKDIVKRFSVNVKTVYKVRTW